MTLLLAPTVALAQIPGRTSTIETDAAVKAASDAPYHHWVACDMTLYQCLQALNSCQSGAQQPNTPTIPPPAQPPTNNNCAPKSWTGGALWKPVSEGVPNAAAVILLPINYCGAKLAILGSNGQSVSGIQRTKCGGNGNRAHFWLSKTASHLRAFAPLTVRVESSGKVECMTVKDPTKRYE